MKPSLSDTQRRKNALKWLSTVRQAKVDSETAAAYLLGLERVPAHIVEQACEDLGRTARAEYESSWPELGAIIARCDAIARVERERAEAKRLLTGRAPDPISPEKWEELKQRFRAVIGRKAMR